MCLCFGSGISTAPSSALGETPDTVSVGGRGEGFREKRKASARITHRCRTSHSAHTFYSPTFCMPSSTLSPGHVGR